MDDNISLNKLHSLIYLKHKKANGYPLVRGYENESRHAFVEQFGIINLG